MHVASVGIIQLIVVVNEFKMKFQLSEMKNQYDAGKEFYYHHHRHGPSDINI